MYKTILVPLDSSERAEAILPHVQSLAHCYESKVIFMTVIEPLPIDIGYVRIDKRRDLERYQRRLDEAERYLAARQEEFRQKGIEAETRVGEGPPVATIINVAEHAEADLIAMASHGRTGLARVFYGSVAAGVLHRIDRPLLLIRSFDESKP